MILHQIFLAIFPSPCFLKKKSIIYIEIGGKRTVSSENRFHSQPKKKKLVGLKKDRGPELGKCKVFPANPKTPEELLFLRTQKHPCYTGSNPIHWRVQLILRVEGKSSCLGSPQASHGCKIEESKVRLLLVKLDSHPFSDP